MSGVRIIQPPVTDSVLHNAHAPAFPFLDIKLEKSNNVEDYEVTLKIGPKLYELLTPFSLKSSLLSYINLENLQIGFWTLDMIIVIDVLQGLKLIENTHSWLVKARESISATLSGKKVESKRKNETALQISKEILSIAGLLDEITQDKYLLNIAKDVINSKQKDPDTIIYRLAMAIYHSGSTGKPVISGIEEPAKAYLNFSSEQTFQAKYKTILERFSSLDSDGRLVVVKTFLSFIAASYLYYLACN